MSQRVSPGEVNEVYEVVNGRNRLYRTTYVTPKGQSYFINKFLGTEFDSEVAA